MARRPIPKRTARYSGPRPRSRSARLSLLDDSFEAEWVEDEYLDDYDQDEP